MHQCVCMHACMHACVNGICKKNFLQLFSKISILRTCPILQAWITRGRQWLRWATIWPQQTWAEKWEAAEPVPLGGGS